MISASVVRSMSARIFAAARITSPCCSSSSTAMCAWPRQPTMPVRKMCKSTVAYRRSTKPRSTSNAWRPCTSAIATRSSARDILSLVRLRSLQRRLFDEDDVELQQLALAHHRDMNLLTRSQMRFAIVQIELVHDRLAVERDQHIAVL